MYACSRAIIFPFSAISARAFSISLAPVFRASASGLSQISLNCVMAIPQCAIAHLGSLSAIALNCCSASVYPKECKSATPRSKGTCDCVAHETGKCTCPSFSVLTASSMWWCSIPGMSGISGFDCAPAATVNTANTPARRTGLETEAHFCLALDAKNTREVLVVMT